MLARLILALVLASGPGWAAPWRLDPATSVSVDVAWEGAPVVVRFPSLSGEVDFDADHPERAEATITVVTGDATTGVAVVDALVRSRDYLAADQYPQITFRLERLVQTSKQTADIHGRITLRGVTRPITFQATVFRYGPAPDDPDRFEAGFALEGQNRPHRVRLDRRPAGGGGSAAGAHPPDDALALSGGMRATDTAASWGWVARTLHWTMAGLILFQLGLGLFMVELTPDLMERFRLTQLHKSWGTVIFALALLRVGWRLAGRRHPALPLPTPRWQARAAAASHLLLYLLMLAHADLGLGHGGGVADPGPARDREHGLRRLRAPRSLGAGGEGARGGGEGGACLGGDRARAPARPARRRRAQAPPARPRRRAGAHDLGELIEGAQESYVDPGRGGQRPNAAQDVSTRSTMPAGDQRDAERLAPARPLAEGEARGQPAEDELDLADRLDLARRWPA